MSRRTTFHFVAIVYDRGRSYYSRRASFSAESMVDAARVVLADLYNSRSCSAYILRDGSTGKRYSIGELAEAVIPNLPWYWWTGGFDFRAAMAKAGL